jgi:outer membrane murein-binding lipoprotein Lpp
MMKYLTTFTALALLLIAGCSGGGSSDKAADNAQTNAAAGEHTSVADMPKQAIDSAKEAAAKTEIASLPEGQEVTVSGKLGCGHCNYHVGTTCSAALQTADGGIYVLDVAEDSEWFQDRYDGLDLKVTGKVHHEGTLVKLEDPNITKL